MIRTRTASLTSFPSNFELVLFRSDVFYRGKTNGVDKITRVSVDIGFPARKPGIELVECASCQS